MKNTIFSFLLLLLACKYKAQETLPIYQQYLLGGEYLLNPAFYGATDDVVVQGIYQKQFSKFTDSPNLQSIGMHANIVDRVGAGASFFRYQNGPISANGITVGSSYFVPIGDDYDRKNQFSFGAAVNFYNMNIDYSKLIPENPDDPMIYEGSNSIFIAYANLGMQFTYRNFFGSFSVMDIPLSNNISIVNGIEPSPTKFLVNVGYDWEISEGVSLEPSSLINLNTNSAKMMDLNLLAKLYNEDNSFGAGISFRTFSDKNGSQQNSISPIIKGKVNRFTFGAAYNFGLSQISNYGGNSFMVSLGYHFENFINTQGFR
ncbi:PorP/SprF family type IX secretion system membrane protein [Elizabethkingia sp. JS20170427COW]|uniref:PorP/SprF family type IX secretion system membrane protein n=1 Tax=Elizabethkingia sp. JS20170427COW TaxID=2583851 RepID=UPI001110003A|nr:PorP/SprF family type IX secretion system membrane protein [Elizabethkingia sp. JS20170427COW]QCX52646.1 type IX secretion system membrane protein PorP/SprF [Elizabethkingia sp. JS20170427COW]